MWRGQNILKKRKKEEGKKGEERAEHNLRVKDKPCDVLLWHPGQLMGKHILQPHQPNQYLLVGLLVQGVAHDVKFNHAPALLQPCRFVSG